jgi:hypothetical protein
MPGRRHGAEAQHTLVPTSRDVGLAGMAVPRPDDSLTGRLLKLLKLLKLKDSRALPLLKLC